jgi:threonine dehydrogenase-like Zn-dependent dehydrogenase
MQIREIVFLEKNRAAFATREATLEPGPRQIVVETLYSFVSTGTERAKLSGLQTIAFPWVPGNRAVALVSAIGTEVTDVAVGDTVLTHTQHASHAVTDGFRARVPDGVPLQQAATGALALVAMTALRVSPPELGDWVVVVGLGPVGLIAAQLYLAAGVEVVGIDRDPARLALAGSLGLKHLVLGDKTAPVDEVLALTGAEGARIVIEATGVPALVPQALSYARRGGDLVLLGSPRGAHVADMTPMLEQIHLWRPHSSVNVKGAHEWQFPPYKTPFTRHSIEENAQAIFSLIARGRLDLSKVIQHVVPAAEAPAAYAGILQSPDLWNGVLFDWGVAR